MGDEIELGAVERLFGNAAGKLAMSSTKSAIGHLLGAAGAVEAIFSVLAIRDNVAPPTLNLDNPSVSTAIDLVPHEAKKRDIDTVLSNSFGFGGTNASLVLRRLGRLKGVCRSPMGLRPNRPFATFSLKPSPDSTAGANGRHAACSKGQPDAARSGSMSNRRPAEQHFSGRPSGVVARSPAERLEPTRPVARRHRQRFSRERGPSRPFVRFLSGILPSSCLSCSWRPGRPFFCRGKIEAPGPLARKASGRDPEGRRRP